MAAIKTIKGAKKGQEKARKPSIAKDSASSVSTTKILYGLSEGEVVGLADGAASIRLEGTPLVDENGQPNFEGVTWDFREGTNEQEYIKGFPDVSNETPISAELKSSTPWVRAINDTQLSAIRVRFRWDRLLQTNDENGDVTGYKIEYAIDLKTDSSAYREVLNTKIEDKTSAGYERTHRIDLPRATTGWQLRIRRITPNSTSEYIQDTMYIDAIAEVIDVKLRYPNTALLGLQYNAETFSRIAKLEVDTIGKIIRVPTNYNPVNKTYSGVWNGTFKDAYSNNPAWIYYDLVTQWRYGIGEKIDDSMIDKWSIYRLGQYCDEKVSDGQGGLEPRFECNVYLQTQEDAYTVLSHLGGIFTAMSYWNGEKIVLDADVPQDPVYTFSAANVVEGNFEYTGTRQRDRHTLAKVAWDNPNNSYQTEYEYIRDEEAMAKYGVKPLDLSAFGCTSQAQAQRLGLRALKAEQLETRQVAFSVGLDGFIPQVGNIINISDELFAGRALSGRVSAVSDAQYVVTLDRDITINSGDTLAINGSNGKTEKRTVKSVAGRKVTLNAPFEFAESESIWALETPTLKLMRFRVMQINQNDDATFNIVALQHDPSKYEGIDNGTDVKDTHNWADGNSVLQPTDKIDAPKNVVISPRYRVEQGLSITTLVVQWNQVSNAVGYIVELKKDNEAWRPLPRTNTNYIELDNAYAGIYTARVRAISPFGVESAYAESVPTTIAKKEGVPTAPLSLSVYGILFGMQLNWEFGTGSADTAFTEIQQATDPLVEASISQQGIYAYPTDNVTIQGLGTDQYVSYRARLIDKFGIAGDWTDWVEGQTSSDAQAALDLLAGQISKTQLAQDMVTAIDKIEVNEAAISAETQARINEILLANDRITGEVADRVEALRLASLRTDSLQRNAEELANNVNAVTLAQTETANGLAVVKTLAETLEVENGVQAQSLDYISTRLDFGYADKTQYASTARGSVWTFAKTVAHADYVNSQLIRGLSADYQDSSSRFTERINLLADKNEAVATQTTNLSAQLVGGYDGNDLAMLNSGLLFQESTARANDVEGLAEQISLLSAGVGEQFDVFEIWHFNTSDDGWTGGTYNDGWIDVKSSAAITSPAIADLDGKAYRHIKMRIKKIGAPTWHGLLTFSGGSLAVDEPAYDTDGIGQANWQLDWVGDITSFTLNLASVADAENYFSIDWIAVGRPYPGASNAALLRESKARAEKDLAIVGDLAALNTQINGDGTGSTTSIVQKLDAVSTLSESSAQSLDLLKADFETELFDASGIVQTTAKTLSDRLQNESERTDLIYSDYKPRYADANKNADESRSRQWTHWKTVARDNYALSEKTEVISAKVDVNDAKYMREITTLATDTQAITKDVQQISAKTEDNLALINSESTARAGQFDSLSTQVTQISAKAQSALDKGTANTGLIQQEATARADQYDSMAQTLTAVQSTAVDADDRSKANTATVQANTRSINGLYGQYTIKVDVNDRIAGIGLAANNSISAFNIRADQFYISNPDDPYYKDVGFIYNSGTRADPETGVVMPKGLYLKAAFIKEASITTAKIRGQAVTVTSSATAATPDGIAPTVYLNSGGGSVLLRVTFFGIKGRDANNTVRLYKNGTQIISYQSEGSGSYFSMSDSFEIVTSGSHGTDSFYAVWEGQLYVRTATVTAISLKK